MPLLQLVTIAREADPLLLRVSTHLRFSDPEVAEAAPWTLLVAVVPDLVGHDYIAQPGPDGMSLGVVAVPHVPQGVLLATGAMSVVPQPPDPADPAALQVARLAVQLKGPLPPGTTLRAVVRVVPPRYSVQILSLPQVLS